MLELARTASRSSPNPAEMTPRRTARLEALADEWRCVLREEPDQARPIFFQPVGGTRAVYTDRSTGVAHGGRRDDRWPVLPRSCPQGSRPQRVQTPWVNRC